eukprot:scaffold154193_cov51-Prasinocladus_malaysianus.AAC.1
MVSDEHKLAQQLRLEHLLRQPNCTPAWLKGMHMMVSGLTRDQASAIWKAYQDLCVQRFCLHPADKLRAL